ncbi:DUF3772 domain-containing protein [Methylobacterium sp. Leaf100]|uniref:DUF3772 domain-containing protein n=1 Tax=Methylobacterium sp. Leaf100 TaxID=1736252 RepID=UPI0006F30C86|nr:DUF3772 domain-containing protein [Methylobacterium sp. Leaf100]KQP31414.1 hypothetical protein ASF25_18485 [Methylobacterium sp. Leaf100]
MIAPPTGPAGRLAQRVSLILALLFGVVGGGAAAQDGPRPDLRRSLSEIAAELPLRQADFAGLSALRDRAEALAAESREVQARDAAALERARTARLDAGRIEPPPERDAAIRAADDALRSAEERVQADKALAADLDGLGNRITEARRRLFAARLFARGASPLSFGFWSELVDRALPQVAGKLSDLGTAMAAGQEGDDAAEIAIGAAVVLTGLLLLYAAIRKARRYTLDRWQRFAARTSISPRRRAAVHALLDMTLTVCSFPLAVVLLLVLNDDIDFTPGSLDSIIFRVLAAVAGALLGAGILRAMVAPRDPAHRLLAVSDGTALIVARTGHALILVYAADLVFAEFAVAAHFRIVISQAATMAMIALCCALLGLALLRLSRDEAPAESDAMPAARSAASLTILTPVVWAGLAVSFAAMLAGYTALGGFLIGRLIVTGLLLALGWVVLICVDALFVTRADIETSPRLLRLSRALAVPPDTLALGSAVVSGVLNVLAVTAMIFVVIGPWNLAYGELNPFRDAFLGTHPGDVRTLVGAAGFAALTAIVGVALTRAATGWLDRRVLPQTRLDAGARYSVITVVGYGGLVLTLLLALGQLGVNPQSLTVIAGALSVGVGFGLQSIVSNFVSGLIVLAERPIRVGDLVTVKGEEGRVKKISVRSTLLATGDRTDLIVPNTDIITSIVRNKTLTDVSQRLRLPVVLAQDTDLALARDILVAVAARHPNVAADPAPVLLLTKLGESLEVEARVFVHDVSQSDVTRSELNHLLLEFFRRAGIKLGGTA